MRYLLCTLILFGLSLLSSCHKEVEIPAYINVKSVEFSASSSQGTSKQLIDFIWVFVDNELRGAYPIGSNIPVLGSGEQKITIYAGFYDNGFRATPEINYLWEGHTLTKELEDDAVFFIDAKFTYIDALGILSYDDFEDGHKLLNDLDEEPNSRLHIVENPEHVFEGQHSGKLEVTENFQENVVANPDFYSEFGNVGSEMYLEMHYKCSSNLTVGIIGRSISGDNVNYPIITLYGNEEYEKIYIDLGELIPELEIEFFQVYYQVLYDPELEGEAQAAYLDNLKIIYSKE